MSFEVLEKEYYEAEEKQAEAVANLEIAAKKAEIAYKKMVKACNHEMKGFIIKECQKCGHSRLFW